jgi:SET domain-containing protein
MERKSKPFSDRVYVQRVGKKGYGVFAVRAFKKGEVILPIRGRVIGEKKANSYSRYAQDHMYTVGQGKYILAQYPDKYINHSCNPNVYEKDRKIIAMENIKEGEELCFHYALNVVENFRMKCYCNHKSCRGYVIGSFFRLPRKEQRKYATYLDSWFKKEFRKELESLT